MKTRISILSSLTLIFIFNFSFAQDKPVQKPSQADSLEKTPFAKRDTLESLKVESNLYWYDMENRLMKHRERSRYAAFQSSEEQGLIYTDMSDIFNNQSLWFDYDLRENGRPAYLSSINKYPHQTAIFYNRILMNDPVHGTFNTQFIPLNFIHTLETDLSSGQVQNFGFTSASKISITPNSMHTKAPWSRIVYKQGDLGFTSLDITFVKPITERMAVQLGGVNKTYDGANPVNAFQGTNYRAEITWQYSPNLYLKGQMFLNRNKVGLTPFSIQQKIQNPGHFDLRDDYFLDMTWLPDDSLDQRLNLIVFNSFSYRKLSDRNAGYYKNKTKNHRYGFDTNFNFFIGKYQFLIGAGAILPRVSGWAFQRTYWPYAMNAYGILEMPLSDNIKLQPAVQIVNHRDFNPQLMPSVKLEFKPVKNHTVSIAATRGIRYPNATELYFNQDTLYGNDNLIPEEHISFTGSYQCTSDSGLQFTVNAGYNFIDKEILWKEPQFYNSGSRDFMFFGVNSSLNIWKIDISFGGQYTFADQHLTPRSSAWVKGHYHDVWLKGAVIIDAYGTINYYDIHDPIIFEPRLERFFIGPGTDTDAYKVIDWKIVATVKDAKIFFEMTNALSNDYEIIHGHNEFYRIFRFGVNWILWN